MSKIVMVGIAILLVVGGIWALGMNDDNESQNSNQTATGETDTMNEYSQIKQEIESGNALLLDVRTTEEFASGHAKDATHLSLQDIQGGAVPQVDTETKLYVYCRSGNRSAQAASLLKNAGYQDVENLGGLDDVADMGAEIVQ